MEIKSFKPELRNLFQALPDASDQEVFTDLLESRAVRIERIVSKGQVTPEGDWYQQDQNEWVLLIQGCARLQYEDGTEQSLSAGDYCLIQSGLKHRVSYTSSEPACIWLAVFF